MRLLDLKDDIASMFQVDLSRSTKGHDVTFDYSTGRINGYIEVDADAGSTAGMSTALTREPGAAEDFVRGSSTAAPFRPGTLSSCIIRSS
jgi:hypothetical protein